LLQRGYNKITFSEYISQTTFYIDAQLLMDVLMYLIAL
jgi:hypothetical protein